MRAGYKQTEVGLIPDDWKVVPILELVTELRGGAALKPSDFTRAGVKILPKGGVGRTGWLSIDGSDLQYCTSSYAAAHRKNQVDQSYTIVVLRDLVPSGPSILAAPWRQRPLPRLVWPTVRYRPGPVRAAVRVPMVRDAASSR